MNERYARPRARSFGLTFGDLTPGEYNAITDVAGVTVGSVTLHDGHGDRAVRTGVTAVVPHGGNVFAAKVPAAFHVINGHGKPTGIVQVVELGLIETPVVLTSTLSVGDAYRGLVLDALRHDRVIRSVNPVVLECNDGSLNDSTALPITTDHVIEAIDSARCGPVPAGNVGAGMGMSSFGWKSGIGSASRSVRCAGKPGVVGTLVLSNFGYPRDLVVCGCDIGRQLPPASMPDRPTGVGSFAAVVATDLPLDARQLGRLARRVQNGIARVGGYVGHTSGEFAVAFSTAPASRLRFDHDDDRLDLLFHAVVDAIEEAIVDSMFCARTVTGVGGHTVPELPVERVLGVLAASAPTGSAAKDTP